MPKQIVSILKREFVDFVINTYNKHGLTDEKMSMLRDFFSESSDQSADELKAKFLIKDSDLPEQIAQAFGFPDTSKDGMLNLAAGLKAMESDDSSRMVIIGKLANLHLTASEINNNNTYLSIDPNEDIRISNMAELFKPANIQDINSRIKLVLAKEPDFGFIDVPLSRKDKKGTFHGDLNLSMFDLQNVRETIKEAKEVFPADFTGRKVLADINEYLDKNYPPHIREKS